MTSSEVLDRRRLRELFDLGGAHHVDTGGRYRDDPYPAWAELQARGPIHAGTVHDLLGYHAPLIFQGLPFPDRPHFSTFSFSPADEALRNQPLFASSPEAVDPVHGDLRFLNSMLTMGGQQHRRYRSLVQPSFSPARAQWWVDRWVDETVHRVIDTFVDEGCADLNVDFCAAIPVLVITGSFGIGIDRALDLKEALANPAEMVELVAPIVADRRRCPQDDLISELVQMDITEEDGARHRLSDAELHSFTLLLLGAGSGTTWRQMGITLAALLTRPAVLDAIRRDRSLLRAAVDEAVRWMPTNPVFSRFVTEETDFHGTVLPRGAVLHIGLGAGSRDPSRWDKPHEFEITRESKPGLGFGGGPHLCLGIHVARATMQVAIGALLDRLPNLRLDPAQAPPAYIGMYHRGVDALPVLFGPGRSTAAP